VGLLAPWFVAGIASIGVPIYLHLLRRHTTTPQPFSSLMFFEPRTQSSIRHRRLRYLLLLSLRLALLTLLALTFAALHPGRLANRAGRGRWAALGRGEVDFSLHFSAPSIVAIDAGEPLAIVAGVHVGCFELIANERVRSIRDLKGKKVGVQSWGVTPHVFVSSMAAYVGLDPAKDIDWVLSPSVAPMDLFAEGKLDAFLGTPPEPQELRARKVGHVIVNSSVDRPWSQYFCCMLTSNQDFVRRNPVATKRVLRAILKATDFCVSDPAGAARRMVDGGFTARYDYALQTLKDVQYNKWREYDPEDTIRFYSLRLREAGMIKSNPKRIIAEGTDWRFLNELKRELKG